MSTFDFLSALPSLIGTLASGQDCWEQLGVCPLGEDYSGQNVEVNPNLGSVGCLGWNTFFIFSNFGEKKKTRLIVVLLALH